MAKEIVGQIKLQIPAGQANPAPPVGPALGQQGVNIMAFCRRSSMPRRRSRPAATSFPSSSPFTKNKASRPIMHESLSAFILLKRRRAGLASGSKEPNKTKVVKLTKKQVMASSRDQDEET